jgi:D-alanyl-lipoteichoic acid acyltransferase DltB (MBOAT superfamily)
MIFNSVTYLIFLALFIPLYWWLQDRPRLWLIFAGSLLFYGFWRYEFILVMLGSICVDYWMARLIDGAGGGRRRKLLLAVTLSLNLGLLCFFKYALFLADNANTLAALLGIAQIPLAMKIILPLGISFYTFHSMSYVFDVYRGFTRAQRDFLLFANYVIFFPQLVAGPILRAREVIWQIKERPRFQLDFITEGARLILSGLFLKVVLADNIAGLVDNGFAAPAASLGTVDVWTLAFLFGFQIYFDFAGYSQVAMGSARLLGVSFPANFNFPYVATSPRDFWKRWHISLSSWIRDYLYLPLCGSKVRQPPHSTDGLAEATEGHVENVGPIRKTYALFLTWALMGLWHGANWTFVLWGLWHAGLIFLYRVLSPHLSFSSKLGATAGWLCTLPLVMLGWIPFRAQSLSTALGMMRTAFDPSALAVPLALSRQTYIVAALVMGLILAAYLVKSRVLPLLARMRLASHVADVLSLAVMVALVFVYLRPIRQFIYFQF